MGFLDYLVYGGGIILIFYTLLAVMSNNGLQILIALIAPVIWIFGIVLIGGITQYRR